MNRTLPSPAGLQGGGGAAAGGWANAGAVKTTNNARNLTTLIQAPLSGNSGRRKISSDVSVGLRVRNFPPSRISGDHYFSRVLRIVFQERFLVFQVLLGRLNLASRIRDA